MCPGFVLAKLMVSILDCPPGLWADLLMMKSRTGEGRGDLTQPWATDQLLAFLAVRR